MLAKGRNIFWKVSVAFPMGCCAEEFWKSYHQVWWFGARDLSNGLFEQDVPKKKKKKSSCLVCNWWLIVSVLVVLLLRCWIWTRWMHATDRDGAGKGRRAGGGGRERRRLPRPSMYWLVAAAAWSAEMKALHSVLLDTIDLLLIQPEKHNWPITVLAPDKLSRLYDKETISNIFSPRRQVPSAALSRRFKTRFDSLSNLPLAVRCCHPDQPMTLKPETPFVPNNQPGH